MNCPACKEPMIVLEHDEIEIDYCVACRGIWLDAGEMELIFGDVEHCANFLSEYEEEVQTTERKRRCPICRKKMRKVSVGTEVRVTYDRCVRGDGLWFDKGELDDIIRMGHPRKEGEKVQSFLDAVFSYAEKGVEKQGKLEPKGEEQ